MACHDHYVFASLPLSDGQGPPMVCVATTHLLFNPRAGEVKLAQLACLLAELDHMASSPGGPSLPCILCGDMNSVPLSPLLRFIETGLLDYAHLTGNQVAGYYHERSRNRPIPTPLFPPDVAIGQDCRYCSPPSPMAADTTEGTGELSTGASGPAHEEGSGDSSPSTAAAPRAVLSHPFSFSSAYPHPSRGSPPSTVTTYHMSAFETVDYIHYTPWNDPATVHPHTPHLAPPAATFSHTGPVSATASQVSKDRAVLSASSPASRGVTTPSTGWAGFRLLSRHALLSTHTLLELGPQPHNLLPSDHLWLLACLQLIWS